MNGKGDKYRVKWSKDFEENYRRIFNGLQEKGIETKKKKVVGAFVDGHYFHTEEIIYIEELKPGKKLGPNPTADNASKGRRVN